MQYTTNLLSNIKDILISELSGFYTQNESVQLINSLIHYFTGLSRVQQALKKDYRLSESEILKLHFAVKRLKKFEPLEYITNECEFHDLTLTVTKDVLIPRPETEELVNIIAKEMGVNEAILDIGTGSGAIALALKNKFPLSSVTAVDISDSAIQIAKKNAKKYNLNIDFICEDILASRTILENKKFDKIISNPPYVTISEKEQMKPNVLDWEPEKALFVPDNNPLIFYQHILDFAEIHLSKNGKVYFEINENMGNQIHELMHCYGYHKTTILKDFRGKYRFAIGKK